MSSRSYDAGNIILQDKASCFPAHLLLNSKPKLESRKKSIIYGDALDACAAPGNKTTHLASILATKIEAHSGPAGPKFVIYACERDAIRTETLHKMLDRAGAGGAVNVLGKQDFLALDPQDVRFGNVTHLLLDPSCSGSGILNREDVPNLVLPKDPRNKPNERCPGSVERATGRKVKNGPGKRKRESLPEKISKKFDLAEPPITSAVLDTERLRKLSNLQTRIIEHAFAFQSATVITYSTCSKHTTENEMVALRALSSDVAKKRSWRVLKPNEQPEGLRMWPHRGDMLNGEQKGEGKTDDIWSAMTDETRKEFTAACIRCKPGGIDGTMGFFVVGFVRDSDAADDVTIDTAGQNDMLAEDQAAEYAEWEGFSADEDQQSTAVI